MSNEDVRVCHLWKFHSTLMDAVGVEPLRHALLTGADSTHEFGTLSGEFDAFTASRVPVIRIWSSFACFSNSL